MRCGTFKAPNCAPAETIEFAVVKEESPSRNCAQTLGNQGARDRVKSNLSTGVLVQPLPIRGVVANIRLLFSILLEMKNAIAANPRQRYEFMERETGVVRPLRGLY